jgi:hypothetical protein
MSDRNDTTGAEAMAEDLFGGGGEPMAPAAGAQDAVAQGYEHTPGVGKGTEGTVLDPAMGGNPVTPEDIPPGPNASSGGQTGGSTPTQSEGASGHRGFDPGRAYTGGDVDPNEIGGVGGVLGGLGVPSTNVSSGVSGWRPAAWRAAPPPPRAAARPAASAAPPPGPAGSRPSPGRRRRRPRSGRQRSASASTAVTAASARGSTRTPTSGRRHRAWAAAPAAGWAGRPAKRATPDPPLNGLDPLGDRSLMGG